MFIDLLFYLFMIFDLLLFRLSVTMDKSPTSPGKKIDKFAESQFTLSFII